MLVLLREALTGWDALEVELREAARLPGADTATTSSAAQCTANALVALLDADACGCVSIPVHIPRLRVHAITPHISFVLAELARWKHFRLLHLSLT